MTAVTWHGNVATGVSGLVTTDGLLLDRWGQLTLAANEPAAEGLPALFAQAHLSRHRVSTIVPDHLVSTRMFRLPSREERELQAMIHHQLSTSLPVAVESVAWAYSRVGEAGDGSTSVLVHVVRRPQLESRLEPLRRCTPRVWAAVPESCVLARLLSRRLGPHGGPRTILGRMRDRFHLLVEDEGELLYHRSFPLPSTERAEGTARAEPDESETLLRTVGEVQAARTEYRNLLDRDLEAPVFVIPDEDEDSLLSRAPGEDVHAFGHALESRTGLAFVIPRTGNVEDEPKAAVARAVAELASADGVSVLPREDVRRVERHFAQRVLLRTAGLVVAIAVAGGAIAFGETARAEKRLERLRERAERERVLVQEVDRMRAVLERNEAATRSSYELLEVLAGLQSALDERTRLRSFSYERGGTVRLRGTTPDMGQATEFQTRLGDDARWRDVQVLQLSRTDTEETGYHFEIVARPHLGREGNGR